MLFRDLVVRPAHSLECLGDVDSAGVGLRQYWTGTVPGRVRTVPVEALGVTTLILSSGFPLSVYPRSSSARFLFFGEAGHSGGSSTVNRVLFPC